MTRLELAIAARYLRSRRGSRLLSLISVIAIGGVIVAVSALIVIIGVMNGLQNDLREKILIGSPDIRVLTFGDDLTMARWDTILPIVKRQPGVRAVEPFVLVQAMITAGHQYGEGLIVMGIEPDRRGLNPPTSVRRTAISGDFSFRTYDGRGRGIVLGERIAKRLDVTPGIDSVTLLTASMRISAVTGLPTPHSETFLVTGIFRTGMYEYDDKYAFVSVASAQRLGQLGYAVTGLEVATPTRDDAPRIALGLQDTLGLPYRTEDWQEQNASLFHALSLEKLGMTVILLLIAIVAAFNIVSTLTMVVADKTREIGILRAMGMPARSIRRIFFVQGVVIGVVGTAIGLVLGLSTGWMVDYYHLIPLESAVYFIDHLPVATQPRDVVLIVVASLAIATLATIYPANQAAKLYPVEAIRHE